MQWSDVSFEPPEKSLRQFAGLWLLFFGGLALVQGLVRGHTFLAIILAVVAVVVGMLGLVRPSSIRLVFIGAMIIAFPIGWLVSLLLLLVLFYGVFTPVALLFKMIGRDIMTRKPRPELTTYWVEKPMVNDPHRYFRQF